MNNWFENELWMFAKNMENPYIDDFMTIYNNLIKYNSDNNNNEIDSLVKYVKKVGFYYIIKQKFNNDVLTDKVINNVTNLLLNDIRLRLM